MNDRMACGLLFARAFKSLAIAGGSMLAASDYAAAQPWVGNLDRTLKAAAGTLTVEDFNAALGPVNADLSVWLRSRTIIGRLTNLTRVPERVRLLRTTVPPTAGFVGEGKPIPVTRMALDGEPMAPLKLAAISVVTEELIKSTQPAADLLLAQEIGGAIAATLDYSFIDPANSGEAGVRPASVTSGETIISSTGDLAADLAAMVDALVNAGHTLETAVFILSPQTAVRLALAGTADGSPRYPGLTAAGGLLAGIPTITSPAMAGDTSGAHITLLEAREIAYFDDGSTQMDVSSQGALQLDTAPDDDAAQVTSLFQANSIALRAIRRVNWKPRRPGAAVTLTGVQ